MSTDPWPTGIHWSGPGVGWTGMNWRVAKLSLQQESTKEVATMKRQTEFVQEGKNDKFWQISHGWEVSGSGSGSGSGGLFWLKADKKISVVFSLPIQRQWLPWKLFQPAWIHNLFSCLLLALDEEMHKGTVSNTKAQSQPRTSDTTKCKGFNWYRAWRKNWNIKKWTITVVKKGTMDGWWRWKNFQERNSLRKWQSPTLYNTWTVAALGMLYKRASSPKLPSPLYSNTCKYPLSNLAPV